MGNSNPVSKIPASYFQFIEYFRTQIKKKKEIFSGSKK
jgi:hypothetical protein